MDNIYDFIEHNPEVVNYDEILLDELKIKLLNSEMTLDQLDLLFQEDYDVCETMYTNYKKILFIDNNKKSGNVVCEIWDFSGEYDESENLIGKYNIEFDILNIESVDINDTIGFITETNIRVRNIELLKRDRKTIFRGEQ